MNDFRKYFELTEGKNIMHQELLDVPIAVFRENFRFLNTYMRKKKGLESMTSGSTLRN